MAARNQLYRLVFGGKLFSGEQWTCSLHTDGDIENAVPASAFENALSGFVTRADSNFSGAATLDFIKYNKLQPFVLPSGKVSMRYQEQTTNEHQEPNMAAGGGSGSPPPQLALVATLGTELSRGRAHAGRIFIPCALPLIDGSGRISAAFATTVAASVGTMIEGVNAVVAAAGTTSVVVFSSIGDVVQNVTKVKVGRVVDTMRSRRTSMDEDHQTVLVAG